MTDWPYPLLGFLSGSVPWSYLLGRMRGVDLRKMGSGNVGATNLFRSCGWKAGVAGLLLDALKGYLPVLVALGGLPGVDHARDWTVAATGAAAVLGHVFTPWLGFRGGKGVATTLGVLLGLCPLAVLAGLVVFIVVQRLSGYVSLGSLAAAATMVPAVFVLGEYSVPVKVLVCVVAALVILRHRSNIRRLAAGEENRFGAEG